MVLAHPAGALPAAVARLVEASAARVWEYPALPPPPVPVTARADRSRSGPGAVWPEAAYRLPARIDEAARPPGQDERPPALPRVRLASVAGPAESAERIPPPGALPDAVTPP